MLIFPKILLIYCAFFCIKIFSLSFKVLFLLPVLRCSLLSHLVFYLSRSPSGCIFCVPYIAAGLLQ